MTSVRNHPVAHWLIGLVLAVAVAAVLFWMAKQTLQQRVGEAIFEVTHASLPEALFADDTGQSTDKRAVLEFIQSANRRLEEQKIELPIIFPWQVTHVRLLSIDETSLQVSPMGMTTTLKSSDEDTHPRQITFEVSIYPNWLSWMGWTGMILGLHLLIASSFPIPLSSMEAQLLLYLRGACGLEPDQALAKIVELGPKAAGIDTKRLDALIEVTGYEVEQAMQVVIRPDVQMLNDEEYRWFLLGLRQLDGRIDEALAVAQGEPTMEIDIRKGALTIHGLPVELDKPSVVVLAWYAQRRKAGDGWVLNPPSNLRRRSHLSAEDQRNRDELLALFEEADVHQRSINSIAKGVTDRYLNQARSRISKALEQTFVGFEDLGKAFFFEEKKIDGKDRSAFRIGLDSQFLHIL